MASQFKIPKKKQPAGADSAPLHTSPLSRLQGTASEFKESYGDRSHRMHAGNTLGSSGNKRSGPLFGDVVKTLLGLNSPSRRPSPANHRAGWSGQSQPGLKAESSSSRLSHGWRPKRASDRLLLPDVTSESPPQKKKDSSPQSISVASLDSLALLRSEVHAGSASSPTLGQRTWKTVESDQTSEDDLVSPPVDKPAVMSARTPDSRRRSLGSELREKERWREFRGKKTSSLGPRGRKLKPTPTEPIVLSSEEEDEGDGGPETSLSQKRGEEREKAQQASRGETEDLPPPSFLQLDFTSLLAGLTHADANGKMKITENGVVLPLKGEEEGEVAVVASQVRGYGVWDGALAQDGPLLAGWKGPAPSLLFLWVTDAQANLLQRELSPIQTSTSTTSGPACSFLLLVLKEQLPELQVALLTSILDTEEYRKGCSSSLGGPTSPLEWSDGLLLLHSCPAPLDQHLLSLLGHSAVRINQKNEKANSSSLQQLPPRLIQYPVAPSKGRITVTKEDLACLDGSEFLNDVIIDFHLKYLLLEGVGGSVAQRTHVFSSFFYKQLSRRRAAGDDDVAPSVPDRHTRHQRVKTWTRHVDIFTKDFLFVPVNQEAHWYLVVVCFPGLEEVHYEDFESPTGGSERAAGRPGSFSLRSQSAPECTRISWQRDTVLKRPCILVMDSLKLSYHETVCRLLREYLQVEWEVRRGTPRVFTADRMRSCSCRVPQQDNSSDCGLYLLQYAESFLQNPVVHFDLPVRLDNWFPRQRVRQKRQEIRTLILKMHQKQNQTGPN